MTIDFFFCFTEPKPRVSEVRFLIRQPSPLITIDCLIMNDPALYASAYDLETHSVRYITEEFSEELGKMSGRCIDIGSGPGCAVIKFILPKLNPRATMVCSDISEDMVNFAKTTYGDNDRLSFAKLDIGTRNLPKDLVGQFDHVTSFYCLHWCNDMCHAFENIFTLLRPGGTVLLNFISYTPVFDTYDDLAAMPRYQPYMKNKSSFIPKLHYDKRPSETLRKIITDVGFDISHLSERQVTRIYDNQDAMSDLIVSVNPFIDHLPADLKKEYKEDLIKTFLHQDDVFQKYNSKNDLSTLFGYRVFIVYLKKPLSG